MFFISQQVFIQFIEICHTDLQIKLAELLSRIPFKSRLQNYIIRVFVYFIYSNYSSSPLQTVVSYLWAYDADNVRVVMQIGNYKNGKKLSYKNY